METLLFESNYGQMIWVYSPNICVLSLIINYANKDIITPIVMAYPPSLFASWMFSISYSGMNKHWFPHYLNSSILAQVNKE